jgi:hypothetical protein
VKRRVVKAVLIALAVWPLAHHALVLRFGVDPWKLFGWAMYCVPGAMKTVRVIELSRDGGARDVPRREQGEAVWRAASRYRVLRQSLGSLARAEATARRVLELRPDWEGVALPILSLELDRETARVRAAVEQASFWRDGEPAGYALPIEAFENPLDTARPDPARGPGRPGRNSRTE